MNSPVTFELARMACRPPRVAILVPGDEDWHGWARLGLYAASLRWGGQGFILLPHHGGTVNSTLLRLAIAYDPDYVVQLQPTVIEVEAIRPGSISVTSHDGRELEGEDRRTFLDRVGDDLVEPDELGEHARQQVAEVCTPHRHRYSSDREPVEHLTLVDTRGDIADVPALSGLAGVRTGPVLACPEEWTGTIALQVAARCGLMETPLTGTEPALDDKERHQLVQWLVDPHSKGARPPYHLVWSKPTMVSVDQTTLPTAFDRTLHGLTSVRRGRRHPDEMVVVVGDTADDFFLSVAWDRTYGGSVWFPSEMWPTTDDATEALPVSLGQIVRRTSRQGVPHLASVSIEADELATLAEDWHLDELPARTRGSQSQAGRPQVGLPKLGPNGAVSLAVREQFDRRASLPVIVDDLGECALAAPPPPLIPDDPDLMPSLPTTWQIDLEFLTGQMPRGRGIDGSALNADDSFQGSLTRSGRDGITYHSSHFGFVPAGASLESTLARPRVRELSLARWVQVKARQSGYKTRPSAAGNRVALLERMWGSREALTDDVAGPLLEVFRAFLPAEKKTSAAYPVEGHGVVLGPKQGYLSFVGMAARKPDGLADDEFGERVDRLLEVGVLVRGLVLGCGACDRPSFIRIDRLAQENECPRCASHSQLTRHRWRSATPEPIWFYDLHWAMRQQLEHHGEVPLLLSHHLRSTTQSQTFTDMAELEFFDLDGSQQAEADLIALVDDRLVIAEAKHNDTFGSGAKLRRAAAKRVELAQVLRADEIALATTRRAWQPPTLASVRHAIAVAAWPAEMAPKLRTVTRLGSDEVGDEYVGDGSSGP